MPTIGYATLPIVPSLTGAGREILRQLAGLGATGGAAFNRSFGSAVSDAAAKALQGAAVASVGLTAALLKTGVSYNALEANSRSSLNTLLGSTTAASDQMDKLNQLVANSPYGKDVFIKAQQQLIGFGMEAKKAIPTLDAVQQAVAASGGTSQTLSEITFVMAQIQAAGKVTAVDLMQMGQRGIDAATLIGSQMGKTGAEIRQSITAGTLGATEALDALTAGMAEKFEGASAGIKGTWTGVLQRISAQYRNLGSVLAEPFVSKTGGGMAVDWANQLADILVALRQKVEPIWDALMERAQPFFTMITVGLDKMRAGINGINVDGFTSMLDGLKGFGPVLAAGGAGLAALTASAASSLPVIGSLIPVVGAIPAALTALALSSPEVRDALGGAFEAIKAAIEPLLPVVANLVQVFAERFGPIIAQVIKAVTPLATLIGGALKVGLDVLAEMLPGIADMFGKIADVISVVLKPIEWLTDIFGLNATAAETAAEQMMAVDKAAGALVSGVGPLKGTLDQISLSFTDVTKEAIRTKLSILDLNDQKVEVSGADSALSSFNAMGVSTNQLTAAILGDAKAMADATAKIQAEQDKVLAGKAAELGLTESLAGAGIDVTSLGTAEGITAAAAAWDAYAVAQETAIDTNSAQEWDEAAGAILDNTEALNSLLTQTPGLTEASATMLGFLGKAAKSAAAEQRQLITDQIESGKIMGQFQDVEGRTQALLIQSGALEANGEALVVTADQYAALYSEQAKAGESVADFVDRMAELNMISLDTPAATEAAIQAILDVGNAGTVAAADLDAATAAMGAFLDRAAELRGGISSALTSFVDPTAAWDKAKQAAQDAVRKANEPAKRTRQGDDPAVLAAKAAVDAGKKVKDAAIKQAKDQKDAAVDAAKAIKKSIDDRAKAENKAVKDAEEAAQKRVDIAKKEADKYQELADAKKKAAEDANSTLEDAEFRARAADAAVAAATLALAAADPTNRAQWEAALTEALKEQEKAHTNLGVAQDDQKAKTLQSTEATKLAKLATTDSEQAEKDLATAKEATAATAEATSARQEAAADALALAQENASAALELTQEAATATYEALVERKKTADEAARASAESSSQGVSDAITEMIDTIVPSLDSWLTELDNQVLAQEEWKENIIRLAGTMPDDVVAALAAKGPAMAEQVSQLVDASPEQKKRFADSWKLTTEEGVAAMTGAIVAAIPLLTEAGAGMGTETIASMKRELEKAESLADIKGIAAKYGVQMQEGIDGAPPTFKFFGDFAGVNDDMRWWMDNLPPVKIPFVGDGGKTDGIVPYWDNALKRASGGAIYGAGSSTGDKVKVLASPGENMWSAAAVKGAGGHAAVGALQSAAESGDLASLLQGGGAGRVINIGGITNIHPVAEPTSVTTNRALAFAATMDGLS